jgi:hypothetical protein
MNELKWGPSAGGWALSASVDKPVFAAEEPVLVTLVLKNVSSEPQGYGAQNKDFDYALDCKDELQESIPLNRFGKRMVENRGRGRFITGVLNPQEQLVNEISATLHLDLSLPGKYTLVVKREIFPGETKDEPTVVSNPCTFEILM